MNDIFNFSFQGDWRWVPGAFWVHLPVKDSPGEYSPPAPPEIPHKGYAVLNVQFGPYELRFCSAAHLKHYIDVLSKKPLPTSRNLSALNGIGWGPNQHWLSRLPAALKAPRQRKRLVKTLVAASNFAVTNAPNNAFQPMPSARLN